MNNNNRKIEIHSNIFIIILLVVIFTGSIYLIKFTDLFVNKKQNNEELQSNILIMNHINPDNVLEKYSSLILPLIALISFFIGCFFISKLMGFVKNKGTYKFFGIYFIILITIILVIYNNTILEEDKIKKYIKGKKFSVVGMLMVLGISALFFGFIDNFGLRLGIDALDNSFLNMFLGPLSEDTRFKNERKNISKNLEHINAWENGKWISVVNQSLRYKNEIDKNPKLQDLTKNIEELIKEGGHPLDIPTSIIKKDMTQEYVRNIKRKYNIISNSKAMLGNTFSNIIGALLSSALINLFTYMTKYDGIYTGDDSIDDNIFVKKIKSYLPFLEGFFITIGCIIPILLNIAMTKDNFSANNTRSWNILLFIIILVIIMMFFSVRGSKDMTKKDKENSIKKTLNDMKIRLNVVEDDLNKKIDEFTNKLN